LLAKFLQYTQTLMLKKFNYLKNKYNIEVMPIKLVCQELTSQVRTVKQ